MTDTFRALCAELVEKLHGYASANPHHDSDELVARARTQLAQPEPEGMTDEGLEVVASQFCDFHHAHMSSADEWRCSRSGLTTFARAVLARWGRPTPQPPADGEVADGEVADLVAALKVIDKMQHEWILLGNDDGTASPSLTMPISLRRFTVIRDALTRAAELLLGTELRELAKTQLTGKSDSLEFPDRFFYDG